jgi:SRSO17 transposase
MRPFQSTTDLQVAPFPEQVSCWPLALRQLHERIATYFARPEPRRHTLLYLQAILSDIPRKNGWQIAEQARELRPYGIQRLLSHAVWDEDGVRNELRTFVCQTLHPPPLLAAEASLTQVFPMFVIDESGFLKRGHHSAGVGSQYCGLTHRVENCQVGVFLSYVTAAGHALIDRELYLPEDWCSDLPRRQAAHIPNHITFETKPELAKVMLQRAQAAGLSACWVVADTVYGHSPDLRQWLEEQGSAYAMAVPSIEVVCVQTPTGCLLSDVADIALRALHPKDWHCLSQSQGTKGPRLFDWARLPVLDGGTTDGRHWLVFRRCLDDPHELAYYLVWAPPNTSLPLMVQAIGGRWHIEEDLQATKALGLDQYETRSYQGWYRHITLVMLAYAFLVNICRKPPVHPASHEEPPTGSPLVPLTASEVRHLLARLFFAAPTSVPLISQWSIFRRAHQYWAGYYHRRRRQKAGSV